MARLQDTSTERDTKVSGLASGDLRVSKAVGRVPTGHRGGLPWAMVGQISLAGSAEAALAGAGIPVVPADMTWASLQGADVAFVVHDPLCPLTPASFLARAVDVAAATGDVVVGYRPVTDTIKTVTDGSVGGTVDREALVALTSPLVLPPGVVAKLPDWPDTSDLADLVVSLSTRFPVRFLEAGSLGRRVADASALRLLEAFAGAC